MISKFFHDFVRCFWGLILNVNKGSWDFLGFLSLLIANIYYFIKNQHNSSLHEG
ncbi:hypothetical protein Micbo1qcDRAFT_158970 [Microdochium bolleyi]|uniref:Uncharacterized protein n=1 Tax=Microdochium bolleyi TaxID=196109 RepID=A0A136JA59_9PEZI|nr:hypothetical protein Micbo1qcDRAFT_158970 [Microdochium bolleyi]